MPTPIEWLEADGLGGFAMGTSNLTPSRRYHSLLTISTNPPTHRYTLVNNVEAFVEDQYGSHALSSFRFGNGTLHPDGATRIERFFSDPWPTWIFRLPGNLKIRYELFMVKESKTVVLSWRCDTPPSHPLHLKVRPLLSGKDYHSLHAHNPSFSFLAEERGSFRSWDPYPGVPTITSFTNGSYTHSPLWYYNFTYEEDEARGFTSHDDLASPGEFYWDLSQGEAFLVFIGARDEFLSKLHNRPPTEAVQDIREQERSRRAGFVSILDRAADAFIVRRGKGKTIIAGYPWFTDWGRDTFIAIRGICLARRRFEEAKDIITLWAQTVSNGMIPNVFPDRGQNPLYNSVDASLWFVVAVSEFLSTAPAELTDPIREYLIAVCKNILDNYRNGTRYRIAGEEDGLLACGTKGTQLTWMDVKIEDFVCTPRVGKPVEIQALWINALHCMHQLTGDDKDILDRARASFEERFWNHQGGYLFDVIDVNHVAGTVDPTLRPNQLLAVGGLPLQLIEHDRAFKIVEACERELFTPHGMRTLTSRAREYRGRYAGDHFERDSSYHQGTAWPWLLGPFVEAWVRVHGGDHEVKTRARDRFLGPLFRESLESGTGHIPEIADGDPPHYFKGCPAQAWSLGELIRLMNLVLS